MRWRLILWGIAAAAFGMPLLVRRALTLFVAPSLCSSRAGLHLCGVLLALLLCCYAVALMAWLQQRFSNNVVAGQRCVGRLLAPCWQQVAASASRSTCRSTCLWRRRWRPAEWWCRWERLPHRDRWQAGCLEDDCAALLSRRDHDSVIGGETRGLHRKFRTASHAHIFRHHDPAVSDADFARFHRAADRPTFRRYTEWAPMGGPSGPHGPPQGGKLNNSPPRIF